MSFTEENIKLVKKFIEIRQKGYYVQGAQVTKVYNEVLGKNVAVTNCSSCLRSRITELEKALRKWEAEQSKKAQEANVVTETENTKKQKTKKKKK